MCAGDPAGQTRREGQGTKEKKKTWLPGPQVCPEHTPHLRLSPRTCSDPLFKWHFNFSGSDVKNPPAMRETQV